MKGAWLLCVIFYLRVAIATDLLVELTYGTIKGREAISPGNRTYRAFQGIPYAEAPLGNLRFKAPEPPTNWTGIKETTKDSNICYSVKNDSDDENEDCLYINVYTPILTNSSSTKVPVMLWIYGGAYRTGSAKFNNFGPDFLVEKDVLVVTFNYRLVMLWIYGGAYRTGSAKFNNFGPDFLVEKDVLVVTFNYRLGPFGFLATEDGVVYGNAGLKDQAAAIQWVHDHIAKFGGDPEQVTIFGVSAGGSSVGYQLLYKKNEGLFRGAILQSGSPLSQFSFMGDISARAYAFDLAAQINSTVDFKNDTILLLDFLLNVPAKQIDVASTKDTVTDRPLPVIEPEHNGAFITKESYGLLENGHFLQVPIMIGAMSEEAITATDGQQLILGRDNQTDLDSLESSFNQHEKNHALFVPSKGFHFKNGTNGTVVGDALYDLYFTNVSTEDQLGYYLRFKSDDQYKKPVIKHADFVSWYTQVYFYIFSHDGPMGNFNRTLQGAGKVGHGEDEKYIWKVKSSTYANEDLSIFPESDVLTHKRVIELWTNFAKYLNPTPQKSELLQNVTWQRVRPYDFKYLDIGDDLVVRQNPISPYYETWSQIYEDYNERPFTVF